MAAIRSRFGSTTAGACGDRRYELKEESLWEFPAKLEAFEGPLDLLLHLIEKNKVNIYDIPIVEITDQYMEYIHQLPSEDLDVMSEFLVMAATLLDIKSKMLLPAGGQRGREELDPREELVQKLLEYKMYKYMSYELKDREKDASFAFYRSRPFRMR